MTMLIKYHLLGANCRETGDSLKKVVVLRVQPGTRMSALVSWVLVPEAEKQKRKNLEVSAEFKALYDALVFHWQVTALSLIT